MSDWDTGCFVGGRPPDACDCKEHLDVGFFAWNNTNQSIPHATWTWLNLTQKTAENPVGICNLTTDTFTCSAEGRYVISSQIQIDVYFGYTNFAIELWKNGSLFCQTTKWHLYDSIMSSPLVTVDWLVPGDYWKVRIYQDSGAAANLLTANCKQSHFCAAAIYLV